MFGQPVLKDFQEHIDLQKGYGNPFLIPSIHKPFQGNGYISSALVLYFKDQMLLQRRDAFTEHNPLKWSFFGGGVDIGESPLQAAVREGYEELNIIPDKLQLIDFRQRNSSFTNLEYFFAQELNIFHT